MALLAASPAAAASGEWTAALDAQLSSVPATGGGLDALYLFSLAVSCSVVPGVRAGVNHVSLGAAPLLEGSRGALFAGPYAEASVAARGLWDPFVAAGLPLQVRWGGGPDAALGLAAYAGAGFRYHVSPEFNAGLEARVTRALSDAWLFTPVVLPGGATTVSAGATLGFSL